MLPGLESLFGAINDTVSKLEKLYFLGFRLDGSYLWECWLGQDGWKSYLAWWAQIWSLWSWNWRGLSRVKMASESRYCNRSLGGRLQDLRTLGWMGNFGREGSREREGVFWCYPGFSGLPSAAIGQLYAPDCSPSISSWIWSFSYCSPELSINSLHHFITLEQMLFCRQWDSNLEWSGGIKPIWDDPPISVLWHQGYIALQGQILPISIIELFHWGKWRAAKVTDHILWVIWQRLVIRNQLAAEGRITLVAVALFTLHQVVIDNVLVMVKSLRFSVHHHIRVYEADQALWTLWTKNHWINQEIPCSQDCIGDSLFSESILLPIDTGGNKSTLFSKRNVSCIYFGEDCMPVDLGSYITSTVFPGPNCQKLHSKTLCQGQWPRGNRENGQIKLKFLFEKSVPSGRGDPSSDISQWTVEG